MFLLAFRFSCPINDIELISSHLGKEVVHHEKTGLMKMKNKAGPKTYKSIRIPKVVLILKMRPSQRTGELGEQRNRIQGKSETKTVLKSREHGKSNV